MYFTTVGCMSKAMLHRKKVMRTKAVSCLSSANRFSPLRPLRCHSKTHFQTVGAFDNTMNDQSTQREAAQTRRTRTFWQKFPEKEELNQYWYSADTVATLAEEAMVETPECGGRVAFLSTPSVYFAVKTQQSDDSNQRECFLFDFDPKFASEGKHFVPFDFNKPQDVPSELVGTFDFVVVDPPFITREVWELYTQTVKLLLRSKDSKVLLTTIEENAAMIHELLGCRSRTFKPSIPHLVYQYALYTNYESPALDTLNPEVDFS